MSAECYWSLAEVYRALRNGNFTATEAVEACLNQIDKYDSQLAAFLILNAASARSAASRSMNQPESLLAGIPYSLKDNIDVEGWATTAHSQYTRKVVAEHGSDVANKLHHSGAILIGKNSMHELATGGPSFDLPWPPARNPWDPSRHPGGSSSGSGVAVAAGMAYFALGTDTGGSVRHPASACGIFGFKPSYDKVSMSGILPLSVSCDHVGVLCRSAMDIPFVMSSIAARACERRAYRSLAQAPHVSSLKGHIVGVIEQFSTKLDADPEMLHAFHDLIRALEAIGCQIKYLTVPSLSSFSACSKKIVYSEAYGLFGDAIESRPQDFGQRTRERIGQGRTVSFSEYIEAREEQRLLMHALESTLEEVDVAICLSSLRFPSHIEDIESIRETYDLQARVPFSLTGLPAMSVPAGVSSNGLPIGLQIASYRGRDLELVRFAQTLEAAGLCGYQSPTRLIDLCTSQSALNHGDKAASR